MSSRKTAIAQIAKVKPLNTNVDYTNEKIDEVFGKYVFSERIMQERLPKKVFAQMRKTLCGGQPLDPSIADIVANAMKDWAIENGATHYAHWFQPMTGLTAQKHDAFVEPTSDGMAICE
ncbi:TPA: glutamine synthetase type III, partial [Candidatus Sumerlaeota bacterium]|nr:glutamine synthetase type III [Candidatus Sumerlaeota bacterium]